MSGPLALRIEDLLRALPGGATLSASVAPQTCFCGVSTDSRTVRPGELFFALRGPRFCGNRFVGEALARGAVAAVARAGAPIEAPRGAPLVLVEEPVRALGALAAAWRDRLRGACVVAITGSVGKTTTRELLRQLLERAAPGRVSSAEKSFNNEVGLPLTILRAGAHTRYLLVEIGTSGPGEVRRLGRIARPEVAIITAVAPAHLEGLGSLEGVAREKGSLLETLARGGIAVLNADDPRVRAMQRPGLPAVSYGTGPGAALRFEYEPAAGRLRVWPPGARAPLAVRLGLPGRHNAANAAAALAACHALGLELEPLVPALAEAKPPPQRLERLALGGVELLDDSYNANPASVQAALEVLCTAAAADGQAVGGRRVAVLGGMHELGAQSRALHEAVGAAAAALGVDLLLGVGALGGAIVQGARAAGMPAERAQHCESPEAAAAWLRAVLAPGDRVLLKASRAERLERVVELLRASGLQPARATPAEPRTPAAPGGEAEGSAKACPAA